MGEALPKKVVLLRPAMLIPHLTFSGLTVPPLGLAYIASYLREKRHEVILIDAVGEAIGQYEPYRANYVLHGLRIDQILERIPGDTEVIGVSCMFSHEFPIYRDWIQRLKDRFPKAHILAGGEHVTALPKETLEQCPALDLLVLGEGEGTILDVVESDFTLESLEKIPGIAWMSGKNLVNSSARRARIRAIDEISKPAWDLVPLENYWKHGMGLGVNRGKSMPLLATRGCPYQCTFCSSPLMWTTRWAARNPVEVVDEMEQYIREYGVENFDFYDLTAIVHKKWIVEFCELLLNRKIDVTYQLPSGTRSEAIDREVAKLLYRSGCRNMTYAPESGSDRMLSLIKKRVHIGKMLESMRGCVEEGLNIKANLIVGFPGEAWGDLWRTFRFLLRMAIVGVHDVTIQPYSAYPGTELFDGLRKDKKITLDDEFYFALANLADLAQSSSWSENFSSRTTFWYRTLGMLAFYGVSYSLRPWRLLRTLFNLAKGKQETRLERALNDIFTRRKSSLPRKVAEAVACPPYV